MKNVKAIFLDMDGTILHENNKASSYTKEVIDELRDKGYKVFLATGRSYSEIHQLVPEGFKVDGIILMVRQVKLTIVIYLNIACL